MVMLKQFTHRRLVSVAVFALLAMVACALPGIGVSTEIPPTETPQATVPSTLDVSSLPNPAPRIVARTPVGGEELPLDGSIDLYFDQPMSRASVESALHFDPILDVSLEWLDDSTLRVNPTGGGLDRGEVYTISLDAGAESIAGIGFEDNVEFEIQTVGYLAVGDEVPANKSTDIGTGSDIAIFFNRPVVPLVLVEDMEGLPHPLSFDPPIPGEGEWVNTSIYMWHPTESLAGGTTYTVTVGAGLEDQTGGVLEGDHVWSFTTAAPIVTDIYPDADGEQKRLDTTVSAGFNQPMDQATVEAAFSLANIQTGQAISGSFEWEDDGMRFVFTPDRPFDLDGGYQAKIASSARGLNSNVTLATETLWAFGVARTPAVIKTNPSDGEQEAEVWRGIEIEFASPMDGDSVIEHLIFDPPLPENNIFISGEGRETDRISFNFELEPATTYTVTLEAGASDPYGNTINEDYTFSFTTGNLDPLFQLNTNGRFGVYDANRPTELFAIYRNISAIDLTLVSLSVSEFGSLTNENVSFYNRMQDYRLNPDQIVRDWTIASDAAVNELTYAHIELTEDEDGSLAPGIYLLIADARGISGEPTYHFLFVSTGNITYKASFDQGLVWLTDIETGKPIPGADVQLYSPAFTLLGGGQTDSDGIIQSDTPHRDGLWGSGYAIVNDGQNFALTMVDWDSGLSPWDFNLLGEFNFTEFSTYIYTDRPLYRPGQEVGFKGIVRAKDDVDYTVPGQDAVMVAIYNDQGDEIYRERTTLSEYGSFSGTIIIDPDASLGYYSIEVSLGENTWRNGFQVAEYRKPEFQVTMAAEKEEVLVGDTIEVVVDAEFFFGGPVSDAEVTWTALANTYSFDFTGQGRYSFTDFANFYDYFSSQRNDFGSAIADGAGRTDADGMFTITLPANLDDSPTSRTLTIEAVVVDINGRTVAGRVDVVIHKSGYYVGVRPDRYVGQAGEEQTASLIVVDWQSNPIANTEVSFQAVKQEWSSIQEKDDRGRTVWTWEVEQIPVGDPIITTTDAEGKASVSYIVPEGGSYKLYATVNDPQGKSNTSSAFSWVSSREYVSWRQSNDNRFDLIADADSYAPGDTAEILIASPFAGQGAQALVTVERGGILSYEVITLTSNSMVYKLPITGQHAPNIYVSVVLLKGVDEFNPVPSFKMGQVKLAVDPSEQTLQVNITPDQESYGPGDDVTYTIETLDHEGNPVDAEVSLALVDLAVLSIAPPNSGPILDHFYGNQALSVRTSLSLVNLVDRLNQELFDKGKGGGGGGGEGFFEVRGNFKDTAYWTGEVRTGDKGTTTVTITLPDNLTTWRLDARAVTEDTLVGQTEVDILATKPLLIRPITPRFFIVGDEVRLVAAVNNNSDSEVEATVMLVGSGITFTSGAASQSVTIPAGGRVTLDWPVVIEDVDWVDLTFSVQGGGLTDASKPTLGDPDNEQKIPVYRYEAPETVGTAGQLISEGQRVEGVVLPPTYDISDGQVTVQINPSLASATIDGLDWLEHYQYFCTEQTVSRFLPNAYTLRAMRGLDVLDSELERELVANIQPALQKLYAEQHPDGGWGWFSTNRSDPTTTAYVVQGLIAAQDAGITVEQRVVDNGIIHLKDKLRSLDALNEGYLLNRQTYVLYVLALADQPDISRTNQMFESRDSLQHWSRALLAQTMWMIDSADPRLETLKSDLVSSAITSATGTHWEEETPDRINWNTDTRTNAIIAGTFAQLWPESDLAPNIIRWLMIARQADHWETTQETVWALNGLTDWMLTTGELDANYDWTFSFNGSERAADHAQRSNVDETTEVIIQIDELLTDTVNRLIFERGAGEGRLYYTTHLTAYLPVEEVDPLNRGLILSRRYLDAEDNPVTEGRVGDILTAEVTIIVPNDLFYVVIEDYYPAGAEAVDTSLLTESVLTEDASLRPEGDDDLFRYGWGWWFFDEIELRDEKAVLYADRLPAGSYQFRYPIRLGIEGVYRVIPPVGWEFYFPEVYGRGEGMLFAILPEN